MAKKYLVSESTKNKLQRLINTGPQAPTTQLRFREAMPPPSVASVKMFQAPSGGIGARASGSNIPVGVVCKPVDVQFVNSQVQYVVNNDPTLAFTVYNWTRSVVCSKGLRYGWALNFGGAWHVVADDCKDA